MYTVHAIFRQSGEHFAKRAFAPKMPAHFPVALAIAAGVRGRTETADSLALLPLDENHSCCVNAIVQMLIQ
jgi:hypothetical protein